MGGVCCPFSIEDMRLSKLVGIRYIGKKDRCEDSVNNTAAVWIFGTVHNFSELLAEKLLRHADAFEAAPLNVDGETFIGGADSSAKAAPEPVAYVNVNTMTVDELVFFAKRELDRHVNADGRTIEDVRSDVVRLMSMATLDEIAINQGSEGGSVFTYSINVTQAEYAALNEGVIKVKLVPSEVADFGADDVDVGIDEATEDAAEVIDETGNDEPITITALLDSLDKNGLIEFAEQEGIEIKDKRLGDVKLREFILNAAMQMAEE